MSLPLDGMDGTGVEETEQTAPLPLPSSYSRYLERTGLFYFQCQPFQSVGEIVTELGQHV